MAQVFLSYSRRNQELANRIRNTLKKVGINVFQDVKNLQSGIFADQLFVEIENAKFFIVLITDELKLDPSWPKKEVIHAITKKKIIIPIWIGEKKNDSFDGLVNDCQGVIINDVATDYDQCLKKVIGYIDSSKVDKLKTNPPKKNKPKDKPQNTKPVSYVDTYKSPKPTYSLYQPSTYKNTNSKYTRSNDSYTYDSEKSNSKRKLMVTMCIIVVITTYAVFLTIGINKSDEAGVLLSFYAVIISLFASTFVGSLILGNNFMNKFLFNYFSFSFYKIPAKMVNGSSDSSGDDIVIFFKVFILILYFPLVVGIAGIVIAISIILSVIAYPIALVRNIKVSRYH